MLKQLIQPLWFVRLALQCSYEPPSLLRTRRAVSKHSSRGQPTLKAIGLAGQDLFGEGSDRGSYRSTLHRCQYPLPHAVRDLPFGGPTRCNGRDTTSSRTSSYHEESGHLRPIGSATCPCHNPAITPDLSSAIDLRQPPTLLLPRFFILLP